MNPTVTLCTPVGSNVSKNIVLRQTRENVTYHLNTSKSVNYDVSNNTTNINFKADISFEFVPLKFAIVNFAKLVHVRSIFSHITNMYSLNSIYVLHSELVQILKHFINFDNFRWFGISLLVKRYIPFSLQPTLKYAIHSESTLKSSNWNAFPTFGHFL